VIVLVVTDPKGNTTRNRPVHYGPQAALAVSETLRRVAPWLTRRELVSAGMQVVGASPGTTSVHTATGYRFRIEQADAVLPLRRTA